MRSCKSKSVSTGEHNAAAMAQFASASSVAPGWLKAPRYEVDFFCMGVIGTGTRSADHTDARHRGLLEERSRAASLFRVML